MQKYIAILILLVIGIIGYNYYSYEKEKEESEKAARNKPKIVDFKRDFNSIFFGTDKESEKQPPKKKEIKEIETLIPKKKIPGSRTLTNKDIERLNKKSKQDSKVLTKDDIQKLKNRKPEEFEEKVKVEKIKKEKPEKKLSPLEKMIDSAKKSFTEKNDDDTEK